MLAYKALSLFNLKGINSKAVFTKDERLKSRKHIKELFEKGRAINLSPLRMVYLPCSALSSHQVLFTVSSKRFKSAVSRNKLKRRMREAYRLHKHLLLPCQGIHFLVGYIYIGPPKLCAFKTIKEKLVASLQHLNLLHTSNNDDPLQA